MRSTSLLCLLISCFSVLTGCEVNALPAAPTSTEPSPSPDTRVAAAQDAVPPRLVGQPAPAFTLTDASGKAHDLASYKGKIVVLEWTEQGCPYVKRHVASKTMQKLATKYDGKVIWLAVNSSYFVKADDTSAWKKDNSITYPVLLDADGKVGRAYGAKTTPHMFVIDAQGKVAYEGAIDSDPRGGAKARTNYVDDAVKALLAGTPAKVPATRPYGCSVKYGKS